MSLSVLSSVTAISSAGPLSALALNQVAAVAQPAQAVAQPTPTVTQTESAVVQIAPAAATTSSSASSSSSADQIATAGSSSLQAVTKDLVALLKALAAGNVSESKADLARLQNDIKAQESASVSAATASEQPPFNVVLNRVAESLAAADTGKALQELASYLIQGGQASGNIVDEHA